MENLIVVLLFVFIRWFFVSGDF